VAVSFVAAFKCATKKISEKQELHLNKDQALLLYLLKKQKKLLGCL
jgi:hypothetical protein